MTAHGWEYERPNPQVVADAPPYWIIADGELRVADVKQQAGETEANARLIASAPELLEACQDAVRVITEAIPPDLATTPYIASRLAFIRKSIAKAIGEQE